MSAFRSVERVAETAARGAVRERAADLRDRVEPPVDEFKEDTADRIETLADEVRKLGRQLERRDEAHLIARRLERTADYLRYRPTTEVASDAWDAVKRSQVLWVAGGTLTAFVVYRLLRSASRRDR